MKKGLIKEAFRLQQIAGIAPVNEIDGTGFQAESDDNENSMDELAAGLQQEAYMENMGPDLEEAMFLIQKAWNHIKNNPALEDSDIASQREGILSHVEELLDY